MAKDIRPSAEAIEIVRQRMRHLAPWHVEPVPMIALAAHPKNQQAFSDETRERLARLSLQVLAVQMRNAVPTGGLERT